MTEKPTEKPELPKEVREYFKAIGTRGAQAARESMTAAQKKEPAKKAAKARWSKKKTRK